MSSYTIEKNKKKSRLPARLDLAQSLTGLILALFMWVHMMLVGSIIFGKKVFYFVAKTMELAFLHPDGHGYPIAVFFAVSGIATLFIIHALLGVRKFPISWKQHRIIRDQMQMMNHSDTNLWYVQVITGFVMFFAASVHLYFMWSNPGSIGPYMSADRIVTGGFWPLYLILLVCVELHGIIGLYRLCLKWNFNPFGTRDKLKVWKNRLSIFFLSLGLLALLVFVVIGIRHRDHVGEKYVKHSSVVEQVEEGSHDAEEPAEESEEESHETEEKPAEEAH